MNFRLFIILPSLHSIGVTKGDKCPGHCCQVLMQEVHGYSAADRCQDVVRWKHRGIGSSFGARLHFSAPWRPSWGLLCLCCFLCMEWLSPGIWSLTQILHSIHMLTKRHLFLRLSQAILLKIILCLDFIFPFPALCFSLHLPLPNIIDILLTCFMSYLSPPSIEKMLQEYECFKDELSG